MNFSLSEILVVLVVALLVIKPEQLPGVAFKLGRYSKQLRQGLTKLRRELDGTVSSLNEDSSPVVRASPAKALEKTHDASTH